MLKTFIKIINNNDKRDIKLPIITIIIYSIQIQLT